MEQALEREPNRLWPSFYLGCCCFHLGQREEALAAFSVCVALAPECAWCYANRGLVYAEYGRLTRALSDYDRALELDATLGAARLGRSVLLYRRSHYAEALDELRSAEELGMKGAALSYQRALIHLARHERADALRSLHEALRQDPRHKQAKTLLSQLERGR
jgi:tetratricopeptide (TPR) repeat protein